MTVDWSPLKVELHRWQDEGLELPLWWRDDDAISVTPQLERLTALAEDLGLPVYLAVIPRDVDQSLAAYIHDHPMLIPVIHGWAHHNHALATEKKSEFRLHRPMTAILQDAASGLDRLTEIFGPHLQPVFVPPWNRIAPEVTSRLAELGYRAVSTATPRKARMAAPGLEQINTHVDPIDWRGGRGLVMHETLIDQVVALLRDRREGRTDNSEPLGVLTHHLVHTQAVWDFTHDLLEILLEGPSRIWAGPEEIDQGESA